MNSRNGNGQSAAPGNNPRGAPPLGQYGILHVIGGNDRGKQCELSKVTTNLGRGADQELVLADIAVSRRHVKIHLQQNGYRLQDLGSGNGTLVNGKKVDDVMLCDGDQIELGNTLLRFEHPPSRAEGAAPPAPQYMAPPPPQMAPPPPPQMPPPQMAPPPVYAPSPYGTAGAPAMPAPYGTAGAPAMPAPYGTAGAQAVPAPMPMAPPPYMPAPGAAFLATDRSRKLAFSVVAVALTVGLLGLVFQVRAATRTPVSETNTVLDLYNTGARHFQAQDFEAAAKSFNDALVLAPESPDLKHYVEACKQEGVALGQIKTGKELEQRRYGAALKTFEQVDKGSVQYDYAQQQARDARREAAKLAYNEARNLSLSDLKGAMSKVNEGLEVDPENPQLLALKSEVASGSTLAARPNDPQPPVIKPPPVRQPPVAELPPVVKTPKVAKIPKATPEPVRPVPTPTADDGKGRLASNAGAMTAYRSRDLGGAINAMNNFAKVNAEPARGRALATVKDLEELRGQLDKAARLEAANPAGAQAAYVSAQALDRRVSGGALASYLGGKVSALQGRAGTSVSAPRPVSAPTQVSMDPARDGKADKMLQEALGLVKKDPNRARLRCREVMRLYGKEVNHPKYQQAYKLLGTIKGGGDDDED